MNSKAETLVLSLGSKLKQARINANLSQKQLAEIIGKSRTAVERAERGKCNLSTFVSIMQALNLVDQLEMFLPEQPISPVSLAKIKSKKRKRASPKNSQNKTVDELGW